MTAGALSRETLAGLEGQEIGLSDWMQLTPGRVAAFAQATEDHQAIHLDPDAGRAAGFAGAVVHGFLTLSMLSAMSYVALPSVEGQSASVNYGFDRVRFVAPVPVGAEIRGRFVLSTAELRSDGGLMLCLAVTAEIRGEERPALSADWRVLLLF
ncbi:MaoC family dehydratase [Roseobacter ponti]|uniref:MaoC family dehydratase n=2 Tax=Roseobacter ponti TaxID=1891787 RepID=A0A858T0J7_9RHOB|nr:MaoC family dehydratase [Roseobacter ponti]